MRTRKATMNTIEKAVEPLKAKAINAAAQYARGTIKRIKETLQKHDWDLDKVAPIPHHSDVNYRFKIQHRHLYQVLTENAISTPRSAYRKPSKQKEQFFIHSAKQDAAAQYNAFVAKLVKKVGPYKSAYLDDNNVWENSILHVTKSGGVKERWQTKMIFNVSKLGKVFNQWPTRKLK